MILQILKKDLKLLWPVVVLVAVLRLLAEWTAFGMGLFGVAAPESPEAIGRDLPGMAAAVGWIVLVAAVVHQDSIPGTRQDWLIRPIRRWHLLGAKLLFLAVLLHAPVLIGSIAAATASGFSLGVSLAAASAHAASSLIAYTLVIVALASVTRNLTELLIGGIGLALLVLASQFFFGALSGDWTPWSASGFAWIAEAAVGLSVLLCVLAVIGLQYFRRGVATWSRAVIVLGAVVSVGLVYLPWSLRLAVQQALSASARPVEVTIDAVSARPNTASGRSNAAGQTSGAAARTAASSGLDGDAAALAVRAARSTLAGSDPDEVVLRGLQRRRAAGSEIALPLTVSGLPPTTILWADRIRVRLIDSDGNVVFSGTGDQLEIRAGTDEAFARQFVAIPPDVYHAHAERDLRLEIDYTFTLLEPASRVVLPAAGGEAALSGGTVCGSRFLEDAAATVRLRCLTLQKRPSCFTAALEAPANERREPELVVCQPNYAPYRRGSTLVSRYGIDIPLRGVRPGDGGTDTVDEWEIRFSTYEARTHFTRQLVVPTLRLADWSAPSAPEASAPEG